MQKILEIAFRGGWATVGSNKIPSSISTACPHCEEKVVFTLGQHRDDSTRRAVAATGRCPGCSKDVQFWAVRSDSAKGEAGSSADVFMYPPAKSYPHREFGIDVPEGLRRSMRSTINALNTKNYAVTAVSARRTLEGIFKYLVPEEKRPLPLAKLIDQATSEVDLAAPLTALSHAIRDGGNLGAHFDMDAEPDAMLARQMVELLDYLISYLYELPKQIEELEQTLGRPSASPGASSGSLTSP